MPAGGDPYAVLGCSASASDAELRACYRSLVKRYHPDHNGGSAESAVRFEQVQDAYAQVLRLRAAANQASAGRARTTPTSSAARPMTSTDMDARIAAMERDIAEQRRQAEQQRQAAEQARRQAQQARRQATAAATHAAAGEKPSREELGFVDTDDNFSSIFADALDQIAERLRVRD